MIITSKHENLAVRASHRAGFSLKHANEWLHVGVPSDLLVDASGTNFALHKFPLISRSGLIRKLVGEAGEPEFSKVKLPDVPGGPEAFELVAKFCYGVEVEISVHNVVMIRCAAEYLEMTEEYGENNLINRMEAFLDNEATQNLKTAVAVLHTCENLLPLADELQIVSRCVDVVASKAFKEQKLAASLSRPDFSSSVNVDSKGSHGFSNSQNSCTAGWWAEELSILRIDFYERVLAALQSMGMCTESIGGALEHFAERSLKGLNKKALGNWDPNMCHKLREHDTQTAMEQKQKILVERIVYLLPHEKNAASMSFLFGLLRTAIILDANLSCRMDLERRIGVQLHHASLDDLLIPSLDSQNNGTLFDVGVVERLVSSFMHQQGGEENFDDQFSNYESDGTDSPWQRAMAKVGKLVDSYLAEVAPDANFTLSKFIALAESVPESARVLDDGLYRAIDIYLKAHPLLTEIERKQLCKLLDFQKLSQDACTHAAQNERLPVQAVVQVLYFEQMRIRNVMVGSYPPEAESNHRSKAGSGVLSVALASSGGGGDHYASVRRENRELKLEVARMRMRLSDLEKDHDCLKHDMEKSYPHHPHHHHSHHGVIHAVSKTLSKLNPFHHHHHSHKLDQEQEHHGVEEQAHHHRAHAHQPLDQQIKKVSGRRRHSLS